MEEGNVRRTGKRTRRTRQQILEAEAALTQPSSSSSVVGDNGLNQKKSLRIRFQDAKSGKLGRQSKSKLSNYVWPRTVESTVSPFEDQSGKNKLFYLIAIGVYPVSKIIQPSDTESEEEEAYDRVDVIDDDSPPREVAMPYFRNRSAAPNAPVYVDVDDNEEEIHIPDERSPSPASPKVRRGRRPTNARRVPYGRANDLDHSWRSNYNRRCAQRRIRQQGARQRIRDPQVIQDIINTVIERYSQRYYHLDTVSQYVSDDNNNINVVNDEVEAVVVV